MPKFAHNGVQFETDDMQCYTITDHHDIGSSFNSGSGPISSGKRLVTITMKDRKQLSVGEHSQHLKDLFSLYSIKECE
jgi:hypothetical protein